LGKLQEAEGAFGRALEIYDEHVAEIAADPIPEIGLAIASDYLHAALFLAATDRQDEAAELVRMAAAMGSKYARDPIESVTILWAVAIVQLYVGDDAGYRATCQALADLPVDKLDDLSKARLLVTWSLAPDALEDLSLPVQRAEELAASNSLGQPHLGPFDIGAALYRNGQYELAAEQLEKSIDAYPTEETVGYENFNRHRLLLAMTKWKQGRQEEARRLFAEALPALDREIQDPSTMSHARAIDEIFRREAVALITPNETDEAVENESSSNDE
jgi:tetratricopeptide (TPR) repeat protein